MTYTHRTGSQHNTTPHLAHTRRTRSSIHQQRSNMIWPRRRRRYDECPTALCFRFRPFSSPVRRRRIYSLERIRPLVIYCPDTVVRGRTLESLYHYNTVLPQWADNAETSRALVCAEKHRQQ